MVEDERGYERGRARGERWVVVVGGGGGGGDGGKDRVRQRHREPSGGAKRRVMGGEQSE